MYRFINRFFELFNQISPVMILTPWIDHFGDCGEQMHFGLLRARREGKKIIFFFPRSQLFWKFRIGRVINRELCDIESDYRLLNNQHPISIMVGFALSFFYGGLKAGYLLWRKGLRTLQKIFPNFHLSPVDTAYYVPTLGKDSVWEPAGTRKFSWDHALSEAKSWEEAFRLPLKVSLQDKKLKMAEKFRLEMGIPSDSWFVCLHVREGGSRGDEILSPHRNADIFNYIPAIELITQLGGWVVRIGDPTMKKLPSLKQVIDYPHSSFYSPLMDVYFLSACRFYFGMTSGPLHCCRLFEKRELLVNMSEWFTTYPLRKGDLAIFKHVYSKSRQRFLSLQELLKEPFNCGSNPLGEDYIMFENSPDEIRNHLQEFLNTTKETPQSDLQKIFNEGRKEMLRRWLSEMVIEHESDSDNAKYRVIATGYAAYGALGQNYLEKNWLKDVMNKSENFSIAI